ncbi:MAG: hypothetical protein D6692_01565 [Planctomycetota bacterium]|nr:MAG: hypothetical protein D6692_01565 [Planctomycetota bacterium]
MAEQCAGGAADGLGVGGGGGGLGRDGFECSEGEVLAGGLLGEQAGVVDGVHMGDGVPIGGGFGDGGELVEREVVRVADVEDRYLWVDHVDEEFGGQPGRRFGGVVLHGPKVPVGRRMATAAARITTKQRTNPVHRTKKVGRN